MVKPHDFFKAKDGGSNGSLIFKYVSSESGNGMDLKGVMEEADLTRERGGKGRRGLH